jgi:hypothetical protein
MQTPLPVELQGQIGQRLREVYNELVSEPVPDRFVELLQQLKMREGRPETSISADDQSPDPRKGGDA